MIEQAADRELIMRYSGGMVKHLGVQMYSGAVGAIAELIANAWDADATEVRIAVAFSREWDTNSTIVVKDNGEGMTFDECNSEFLLVGRDRRKYGEYTEKHRKVIGRKGLGKLACFGIAKIIEVRTIKNGWLTHFALDYDAIIKNSAGELVSASPYKPRLLKDEATKESSGTAIILKRIQLKRLIDETDFRKSMARRFAILQNDFRVLINGILLNRDEAPFQFRFPRVGTESVELPAVGTIRWWAGFTEKPIPDEDARGIVVMVRGRMAQAPFFFHLSGGVTGQHGMQYLTGEVSADGLDDSSDVDVIATDRASIRWEDPTAKYLLDWGAKKVKDLLSEWADKRTEEKLVRLAANPIPQLERENHLQRINRFPARERKEIMRAIQQFATIPTMTQERFEELVDLFLKAFENQHFMDMIRSINALEESQQTDLFKLIAEANILEAVQMASIIRVKVEIIRKFREMIDARAREKPDMQDILRDNPWLIDPSWNTLEHEKTLDTIVQKHFLAKQTNLEDSNRRLDLFCLGDSLRKVVVEVKRPGLTVGREEIQQAMDYVFFLRYQASQSNDPTRKVIIQGFLIASKIRPEDASWKEVAEKEEVYVRVWDDLWASAERLYGQFLDLVKSKAPADDPRIQAIDEFPLDE